MENINKVKLASEANQEKYCIFNYKIWETLKDIGKVNEKKNIFVRNDVEARASVRTPSYAPGGRNAEVKYRG